MEYENTDQKATPVKETPQLTKLSAKKWQENISSARKNQRKWLEQASKIVRRFLDRRESDDETSNKINLFTSNTQILISTLYARFPKPLVLREYEDPNDDVARVAGEILERLLHIRPRDDFDAAMRYVVQDRLVPGLGTVWLRYESDIEQRQTEPVIDETTGEQLVEASEYEVVVDERVVVDYVFYRDIIWSPARVWEDIRWIARRCRMTKSDVTKRFGDIIANQLVYTKNGLNKSDHDDKDQNRPEHDDARYVDIYECWDKTSKKVYWFTDCFDYFLDVRDDPLELENFFPTPRFLMALTSTSNYMPRPDYLMAQDQYEELDMVNTRITWLERAIKVIGIYDGNNEEIARILEEGIENKIIPTRSFSQFAERGGFKGSIDWLPLDHLVSALDKLQQYRQTLVAQIYELTGISDIMRGATKASETAAAQQLKAQYGSVKLQFLQMEVAAFVEEALKIKAQIITSIYEAETIARLANVGYMYDQELVSQAIELLKSPEWKYRIEVHADSMAVPEFSAERDDRMGFMRATAEMLTAFTPLIEKEPAAGAVMLEMVKWAATSFRSGRTIEGVLDKAIQSIQKAASQPKEPPPPDPEKVASAKQKDSQAMLNMAKAKREETETQMIAITGGHVPSPLPDLITPETPTTPVQ